jgi:hypothetical protein
MKEISTYRTRPALIWGTEDTPRDWRGRQVPCVGTAGDNPDNIYRSAVIDGSGQYEVAGRFNASHRASQLIIQLGTSEPGVAPDLTKAGSEAVEVLAAFDDKKISVADDGTFKFTFGGKRDGPNHVELPAGLISVGFRDSMADWTQQPVRLVLRRLDSGKPARFSNDELRTRIHGRLGDYVQKWSVYPTVAFGGLKPNTHSDPVGRSGGWGFVAGLRFSLALDEAVAVTISRGQAKYLGFQVVDPWTIAGDARRSLTSLNRAQATPDLDGNYTFVIAPKDPGVANWLDTEGLHDGFGIIRWQATPSDMSNQGLFHAFRVIKLADARTLPGIVTITPDMRKLQLEKRAREWANRLR